MEAKYQIKAEKLLFGIVVIQMMITVLLLSRLNEIGDEECVGYERADLAERICPPRLKVERHAAET